MTQPFSNCYLSETNVCKVLLYTKYSGASLYDTFAGFETNQSMKLTSAVAAVNEQPNSSDSFPFRENVSFVIYVRGRAMIQQGC